ncbi:hypothetical protein A2U01_0028733, partial [Trifolium medium]|nr:hypothetical protein [Trifolium medium]
AFCVAADRGLLRVEFHVNSSMVAKTLQNLKCGSVDGWMIL